MARNFPSLLTANDVTALTCGLKTWASFSSNWTASFFVATALASFFTTVSCRITPSSNPARMDKPSGSTLQKHDSRNSTKEDGYSKANFKWSNSFERLKTGIKNDKWELTCIKNAKYSRQRGCLVNPPRCKIQSTPPCSLTQAVDIKVLGFIDRKRQVTCPSTHPFG